MRRAGHRRAVLRSRAPQRRPRPQQPGAVAPGHEPSGGGRAADAPALAIDEQSYGAEHPEVATRPEQPGAVAPGHEPSGGGRAADAPAWPSTSSPTEPSTPTSPRDLNNLAQLLQATNRLAEAEPLMRRALAIDEQSYGAEHPDVATRPQQPGELLQATNRLAEAEPLMRRALAIDEQSYGAEHPTSPSTSTTWRACSGPRTVWRRPSR